MNKLIPTICCFKSKIKSAFEKLTTIRFRSDNSFQLVVFRDDDDCYYDCFDGVGVGGGGVSDDARVVAVVPHVPDEIVSEILCRLPADKMLECRTVCKVWKELSSNPYFTKMHLEAGTDISILLRYQRDLDEEFIFLFNEWDGSVTRKKRFNFKHIHELRYNNYASSSWMKSYDDYGVISFHSLPDRSPNPIHFSVFYNPITHQKLVLHTDLGRVCAFFYHSVADEYRVLWSRSTHSSVEYQILCLGSSSKPSWRRLKDLDLAPIGRAAVRTCDLNGDEILHWVSAAKNEDTTHCDTFYLMFDVNKEEFSSMPHPGVLCSSNDRDHRRDLFHLELKSSCCSLLCVCDVSTQDQIDMWVLEDHQKQTWVKTHRIVLDLEIYRSEDIYQQEIAVMPFGIVNGEMLIDMCMHGVFAYNFSRGTLRRIIKMPDENIGFQNESDFVTHVSLFRKSLVSFKHFHDHHLIMEDTPTI